MIDKQTYCKNASAVMSSTIASSSTIIPTRHRPIFDSLTTDEDKLKAAMAEYNELKGIWIGRSCDVHRGTDQIDQ